MAHFSKGTFVLYCEISEAHRLDARRPASQCPKCDGSGFWRRGVGFEHEKICQRHDPSEVWCPEDVVNYRQLVTEQMIGQDGHGI